MPAVGGGVLVVEDDDDIRADLSAILRVKGFAVDEVANGREALARMQQEPRPGVVVLDLMMPVMNGWELRAIMRKDPALDAIPVIVVSGKGRISAEETHTLAPAAVLVKPFELTDLLELVGSFCPSDQITPAKR